MPSSSPRGSFATPSADCELVCNENSNPDVMMVNPQINRHRR
jgi:hypothetical protein